jgi:hypothetical protein
VAENIYARAMIIAFQTNVYMLHDSRKYFRRVIFVSKVAHRSSSVDAFKIHLSTHTYTHTTPVRCCRINNFAKAANLSLVTTSHLRY